MKTSSPSDSDVQHGEQFNRPAAEELYFRALDSLAEGRPADAVALLRRAVALDENFLDAQHALVRALQDEGRLDEALLVVHRLIALDRDDVLAHTRLSILYQAKGMIPEAEAEAVRAKLLGWKRQLRASAKQSSADDSIAAGADSSNLK